METANLHIDTQNFELHPSGAMYWREQNLLLIADVHLGKVTHFRKHGSAVPQSVIAENFDQLNEVNTYFQPKTICFLGDLFHSYLNNEWILFSEWVKSMSAKIILIEGNHDVISSLKYEELHIDVVDELLFNNLFLTHHPEIRDGLFNIAGHIHPGIRLRGNAKQSLTVSCFVKKPNQLILPSFGSFTGKHIMDVEEGDQIFAVTDDEVIRIQ